MTGDSLQNGRLYPTALGFGQPQVSAWVANKSLKKSPKEYEPLEERYATYSNVNELLKIHEVLEEVVTKTISLLTTDVITHSLLGVGRDIMEEALKGLQIPAKILAKRSNAMWDVLVASKVEAKKFAWYMGTRRIRVTLHGVPLNMSEERMGAFFPIWPHPI